MGKFSEQDIEEEEIDFLFPHEDLTAEETFDLQVQSLLAELEALEKRAERLNDRMKYYGEAVSREDIEHFRDELKRIRRDFR